MSSKKTVTKYYITVRHGGYTPKMSPADKKARICGLDLQITMSESNQA